MENGSVSYSDLGTPQGGVVSPVLANVFLHHVIDKWFHEEVVPRLRGRATLVRYADDVIIACAVEDDVRRVMEVLPHRLGRFGLTLHPEKTCVVPFRRPPVRKVKDSGHPPRPGTFDFLGFTHYWGRSRKGYSVVKKKTASSRQRRTLKRINERCRKRRHLPLEEQRLALTRQLLGHYAYFGVTGNSHSMQVLYYWVERIWKRWLNRRSQHRDVSWERFKQIFQRYPLPRPRIVHRWTG